MKTRDVTIKIPKWIPTKYQLRAWKKKLYVFFFPPRCHSCKCKIPNDYGTYVKRRNGTHPLGYKDVCSNFVIRSSKSWCRNCIKKYIHQLDLPIKHCTLCEKPNAAVIGHHYNRDTKHIITFCWHWWNGSNFCLECVDDLLDTGTFTKEY